ncbi:hypothetical protein TcCL_NonESM10466, partial [Trypanosoma cruzi]
MPVGTARERRRRRCSAGRRPCDAHTPRRCARSALVPFCHGQASPRRRPCVVALIEADGGGVPAALTGGGGPVPRSPLAAQRAAGGPTTPRAACVLPVSADASSVPRFPGTSQAAVSKGGATHRSERAAGCGYKIAQQRIQYTAGARGQDKRRVAKGQFKRTQREGPNHIPATRGHASTKCADGSGDRGKWDSDDATDERVSLLPDFVGAYQRYTCRLRAVSDAQRQKLLRGGDVE